MPTLLTLAVGVWALEIGSRAFPREIIPVSWLKRFNNEVRTDIAVRLGLPNTTRMWELPRDDGGPPLFLHRPKIRTEHVLAADDRSVIDRDAQGFCNPPRDSYKRPSIDILILGDSFANCISVNPERTWMSRAGEVSGFSVYNFGKGGIGPYEYIQILKYYGKHKNPRMVIMNVYEGNDLRDSIRYHEHVAALERGKGGYFRADERFFPEIDYENILDNFVGRNSYAANLVVVLGGKSKELIDVAYDRMTGQRPFKPIEFRYALDFGHSEVPLNVDNLDGGEVRLARTIEAGQSSFEAFDDALETFSALAEDWGFTPVVTYTPAAYTSYVDFRKFADADLEDVMTAFSRLQREYLGAKALALNITFLDLTSALQEAAASLQDNELLYYPANNHFTPTGHRIVGVSLGTMIREGAIAGSLDTLKHPIPDKVSSGLVD